MKKYLYDTEHWGEPMLHKFVPMEKRDYYKGLGAIKTNFEEAKQEVLDALMAQHENLGERIEALQLATEETCPTEGDPYCT